MSQANASFTCLIVDDEDLSRLRIRQFLQKTYGHCHVDEAEDGIMALEMMRSGQPDILFLDIEMPVLSGFDVIRQLPERTFQLVFQTAFDSFAIKAFEESACDYLLKPFTDERLNAAVLKALSARQLKVVHDAPVQDLEQKLVGHRKYLSRFLVQVGRKSRVVDAQEVLGFYSEAHMTQILLPDIDFAYEQSLEYLERHLDPSRFYRIHRNSIVNLRAIRDFNRGEKACVTLLNGRELPVSRHRKAGLIVAIEN